MLSGIPQVAQIGPSLVAKNGTPFCLFTKADCSIATDGFTTSFTTIERENLRVCLKTFDKRGREVGLV